MTFIYEKGTNKFLGVATQIFDNGNWRDATLQELYPNTDHSNMGVVVVKDSPKYYMDTNAWQFAVNAKGEVTGIERKPIPGKISLTTDAKDTDGDGLPELKADGTSKATINIEIRNAKGDLVKKSTALRVRTTGGRLSARTITTKTGTASVDLTANLDTVTVTVSVAADDMETQQLTFELMP
jgi:hypothetical protein